MTTEPRDPRVVCADRFAFWSKQIVLTQTTPPIEVTVDAGLSVRGTIRDSKGVLAGVVLIFRDITRKRREEERSAFLSDLASQLIESSLDYDARLARMQFNRSVTRCFVP